jgi:endonuclease/exonuclease/phosphatase family metal-dependent hydrolase
MSERLRIASFNIRSVHGRDGRHHWFLRRRACVAAIRVLQADVVGLQEVRPGQLRYLRRALACAQLVGAGRDADGGGEHAAVLVDSRAWALESADTRWLSATPDVPGSRGWDAGLPRVATLVRLRRGTVRLGVANTHFDDRGGVARDGSAGLLLRWLSAESDRRWVVVGDLNADPGSAPVRRLLAAGYRDALADVQGGTEHGFTGALDRRRIDHILVGPGVTVESAEIRHDRPGGRLPSDHWPVLANLVVD